MAYLRLGCLQQLLGRLARYNLSRVVVEATGRREYQLVLAAAERGFPVIIYQPIKVRKYAGAKGVLAKTDKIDAQILADYAAVMKPEVRPIALGNIRKIKELSARQRQLVHNEYHGEESSRCHAEGITR